MIKAHLKKFRSREAYFSTLLVHLVYTKLKNKQNIIVNCIPEL